MRVESLLEAVAEKTSRLTIASKSRRIEVLDQLLTRQQQLACATPVEKLRWIQQNYCDYLLTHPLRCQLTQISDLASERRAAVHRLIQDQLGIWESVNSSVSWRRTSFDH